jgi:NADPH2:quinone reductase
VRAVLIEEYGPPEVLHVDEVVLREAGRGEVTLRVEAAGVNPTDAKIRRGELVEYVGRPLPLVPGWDACGVVDSVGAGVTEWVPGDRVVAMWDQHFVDAGSYAEGVVLPGAVLAPAPAGADSGVAAALPLSSLTAAQALDRLALPEGASLLVTGAAGAVGGFAAQLGRHRGLAVIPAGRGQADSVEPCSVDAVLHTAGPTDVIRTVREGGGYLSVVPGGAPEPERGIEPEVHYVEASGPQLRELAKLVEEGVLTPRVADVLPLGSAAEAHRRLEAGGLRGRLVLDPTR